MHWLWLATHLAHRSITVYPYPALSNDRPGDPVLPKIWSLLTFFDAHDDDHDDKNNDEDDDGDRKCSVNKGDWAAASSS